MRGGQVRRVVVTGVGVVAPCGIGRDAFWAGLLGPAPAGLERRIEGFSAEPMLSRAEANRLDRFAQLAVVAGAEALEDAKLDDPAGRYGGLRCATIMGNALVGAYGFETGVRALAERGPRRVPPLTIPLFMPNANSAALSMRYGLQGTCQTITTACAAGTHAIGAGAQLVADGRADLVLAGGSEGCLTDTVLAAFTNMGALSKTGVSRPFDAARDGFCPAEGAAVLVLEERESALARGASAYMEIAGHGNTADAHHLTAPSPDGRGAMAAMREALDDAGLTPADIVHVNAHGTSTPLNDAAEAKAISAALADGRPAVTSIKGVTGHALGAAGALEAAAVALSMRHRTIPPTAGLVTLDPEMDLDVVTDARPWEPGPTLSNSFAFGGHNGCLALVPA
jgi:3-oxoacyl-[acyl-carrier-protein] synthase II